MKKDTEEQEKKAKREAEKQKASLKVITLVQSLQSGSTYAKTHHRFMAITRKLAIFVRTTNVPNSIVENLAFKDLLNTADPKYIVSTVIRECIHRVESKNELFHSGS